MKPMKGGNAAPTESDSRVRYRSLQSTAGSPPHRRARGRRRGRRRRREEMRGNRGRRGKLRPNRRTMTLRLPPCPSSLSSHMTPRRPLRRRRSLHHPPPPHTVDHPTLPPRRPPIAHAPLPPPPPPPPPLPPLHPKGAKLTARRAARGNTQAPARLQRKNARGRLRSLRLSLRSLCQPSSPTTDLCPPSTSLRCRLRDGKFLSAMMRRIPASQGRDSTLR